MHQRRQTADGLGRFGRWVAAFMAACVAVAGLLAFTGTATPAGADITCDALCTRVRSELASYTSWLTANNAKGYVGEVGWSGATDAGAWNALADLWYRDADAAGLWVTQWATGEWWPNSMTLGTYINSVSDGAALDTARPPATVVEAHPSTASVLRGVNLNGGEFGAASWSATTSSFSNANPGAYESAWHYDTQGTFNYLATRGIKLVRLPFRWERLQPTLGGPLDAAELQRITGAIARAGAAGIKVIPTAFNYGGYMLFDGTQGVRRTIGTASVTNAHFADLWSRLSTSLRGNAAVAGYGLMNEPAAMTAAAGLTPAQTWEQASQAAVNAIRAGGDTALVMVPGYNFSGVARWTATHARGWITDSANNFRYEAHQYFDRDGSGEYAGSYAAEVTDAVARGFSSTVITTPTTAAPPTTAPPATTPTTAAVNLPKLSVNDRSVTEGKAATFTIKLSATAKQAVTVTYAAVDGSARWGSDYLASGGSVTIPVGKSSVQVTVKTVNDTLKETSETFSLQLSAPANAAISDASGTATIAASD